MQVTVQWVRAPSTLEPALDQYMLKVMAAVLAVAQYIAQQMQDDARRDARWIDRTGNARSGLFGQVEEVSAALVNIYLSHSMFYGLFLELSHGGRYAIIMPTIERTLPVIEKMLKDIFN